MKKRRVATKTNDHDDRLDLLKTAATIARHYYIGDKDQKEIADDLNISQAEVSRLLKLARQEKIVEFTINPYFTNDLRAEMLATFGHLHDCIIEPISLFEGESGESFLETLGKAGAQYFLDVVKNSSTIGVSCGHSIDHLVEALGQLGKEGYPLPIGCVVFALLIMRTKDVETVTPASLVANLVRRLPDSRGVAFQLPPDTSKYLYSNHDDVKNLLREIKSLDYYFTGIGSVETEDEPMARHANTPFKTAHFNSLTKTLGIRKELNKYKIVGEIAHQPFDAGGNCLIDKPEFKELQKFFLYLPLSDLRKHVQEGSKHIIAISGGKNKERAIHGGLHGKFFNVLITDAGVAIDILRKEGRLLPNPELIIDKPTKSLIT